jgi:hypothetical protein
MTDSLLIGDHASLSTAAIPKKLQIVITLGQSHSLGATIDRAVLSTTPRFPDHVLALNFGSDTRLASGWRSAPVNEASFLGFAPLREAGTETHVSGMMDALVNQFINAGRDVPTFLHINGGEGGRSILQLMTSKDDIFASYQLGLDQTVSGNVFAVTRPDGKYDAYVRTETGAIFERTINGPLVYFDNVETQLRIAVDHARSQGYEIDSNVIFNWMQGSSDNSVRYGDFLDELFRKMELVVDQAIGTDAAIMGIVSQNRGFGTRIISTEQLSFINDEANVGFGAAEYQFQARYPAKAGVDYSHLNPEGYYMLGQQIGRNIFDFMTGNENLPILIDKVEQPDSRTIIVNFANVDSFLVADPAIFAPESLMRAPSNLGFGVYRTTGGLLTSFAISSAQIVGPASVRLEFDRDLTGEFRLYLGRTEDDLSTLPEGGLSRFGGTVLRDAAAAPALGLVSGATLKTPYLYEYAPVQFVDIKAGSFPPPPLPPPAPPPTMDGLLLYGTAASDTLVGSSRNDIISGVPNSGTEMGLRQIDRLTGGSGSDLFILGDNRGAFYNRNQAGSAGVGDYAVISDFGDGDRIQVAPGTYFLQSTRTKLDSGTGIFLDKNGDGAWDNLDELIAIVNGTRQVSFSDLVQPAIAPPPPPPPPPSPPAPPPVINGLFLHGTTASDTLVGGSLNDRISGVPNTGTDTGLRQIDRLTGGAGDDIFVLGDQRGIFYNRNQADSTGVTDYAVITDFSDGDRIQVAPGTYFLQETRTKTDSGTGIFLDKNGDGAWDRLDELIAIVNGPKPVVLSDLLFG